MKRQKTQKRHTILKEKNKFRHLTLPNINLFHKAIGINTV